MGGIWKALSVLVLIQVSVSQKATPERGAAPPGMDGWAGEGMCVNSPSWDISREQILEGLSC